MTQTLRGQLTDRYGKNLCTIDASYAIALLPGTPIAFEALSEHERSRWMASPQAAIVALE